MKLDRPKIIILFILAILVLTAIISGHKNIKLKTTTAIEFKIPNSATEKRIPSYYISIAKKYDAFKTIFNHDKKTFVYGYSTTSFNKTQNEHFHNEMNNLLKNENLDYEIIQYKDWDKEKRKLEIDYTDNLETCTLESEEIDRIVEYLDFVEECMTYACIINTTKKRVVVISRDAEYILEVLKGEQNIIRELD